MLYTVQNDTAPKQTMTLTKRQYGYLYGPTVGDQVSIYSKKRKIIITKYLY